MVCSPEGCKESDVTEVTEHTHEGHEIVVCRFSGFKELHYHSPLCLRVEKNSARGKVIDKKGFTGTGCLWSLQAGR